MTGCMKVKELSENGLFISDIDWDDCFKDKGNPKGNFVMIVEPLYGGVIYYRKIEDGFLIEGEGYILTGRKNILEKKVNKWVQEYEEREVKFVEKHI